ncbi:methyl-accepting chemotaxis protein [Burkholderia gladioli]|uniref:methyl-accepting chemotaxis protein n=1 Tax=Burkholderia gladioli TaxID=28095 RepID=UPI001FC7FB86|nr:methyl-accepting chemotaxis protein [Burkholderia gladioli]
MRTRILLIAAGTVIFSLALTTGVIYALVRADNLRTIRQDLDALATANAAAIAEWSTAHTLAITAAAEDVAAGDPGGLVRHLQKAAGFSLTTAGWRNKAFASSTPNLPANYDVTGRPWYQESMRRLVPLITAPYRSVSGVLLVSFTAPIVRDGKPEGVVAGGVSLDTVRKVVAAIHPTPSSIGFVTSRDATVIAHPNDTQLLKPAAALLPALSAGALGELAASGEVMQADLHGRPALVRVKPIAGTDWLLVIALDRDEATAGMRSVVQASIVAVIALAVIATLFSAFMTGRSFRRLSQARDAMDEISSGSADLTRRLPVIGGDEVSQIAASFNTFVEKIGSVLKEVRAGSESLSVASRQIDSGNLELSGRTELSAANLHQTSTSLDEITRAVESSAQASNRVAQVAKGASESAAQGREVMADVVATMQDIHNASANIVQIIGVIDGIAFQTNILALNASVEAARAGEHGRSFAVVAGEVRSLSQRSAQAARQIKALVTASAASIRLGGARVLDADRNMEQIATGIQRVTCIVGEINHSMREQSQGIAQINQAVSEMEHSTHQNAALVQEAAAASSTLRNEASRLNQLVGSFKLEAAH